MELDEKEDWRIGELENWRIGDSRLETGFVNELKDHADHANVKIHPPILLLLHVAVAFLVKWSIPVPFVVPDALRSIGLSLAVLGFLFGVAAFVEFGKAGTTLDPHGSVKALVTNGVYRITRNPIYFGFLLMLIGILLNRDSYWGAALAPVFMAAMNKLVIQHEEDYLERKFGEAYRAYKSRVRRWLW